VACVEGSAGLPDLLEMSVRANPHAVALAEEEKRWTYRDLWQQIGKVAEYLRTSGVGAGDRVGILLDNSMEYVATYYGVLQHGGISVPLNTAARARDLVGWLKHAGASVLFARHDNPELAQIRAVLGSSIRVVAVGQPNRGKGDAESWEDVQACHFDVEGKTVKRYSEESAAAIIYTSGTTGTPKGVTLTHRNLVANTMAIVSYLGLTGKDCCVTVLPFFYSFGNSVLHTHLASGGRIVVERNLLYPHKLVERITKEGASCFYGVPSTYALLLARVKLAEHDLSCIRFLAQAGGPMQSTAIQQMRASLPGAKFIVMYGQTEATARITYLPPERLADKLGSVGIPVPGVKVRVYKEDGSLCEPGEIGEICVFGDSVMRGYWNSPETTASVLRDGWLRTGDLGRQDDDGFLYIVGRASEMIKTGAHRVSPTDIEEVIMEIEGVDEVAAVGVADEILGQVIRAYVVRREGSGVDATTVRSHCRAILPTYKMPKFVEFVSTLPKTASGKIRRLELAKNSGALPLSN